MSESSEIDLLCDYTVAEAAPLVGMSASALYQRCIRGTVRSRMARGEGNRRKLVIKGVALIALRQLLARPYAERVLP